MSTINEKQIKNQLQRFDNSSNQLTKRELLLVYGGDPTGNTATPTSDESG